MCVCVCSMHVKFALCTNSGKQITSARMRLCTFSWLFCAIFVCFSTLAHCIYALHMHHAQVHLKMKFLSGAHFGVLHASLVFFCFIFISVSDIFRHTHSHSYTPLQRQIKNKKMELSRYECYCYFVIGTFLFEYVQRNDKHCILEEICTIWFINKCANESHILCLCVCVALSHVTYSTFDLWYIYWGLGCEECAKIHWICIFLWFIYLMLQRCLRDMPSLRGLPRSWIELEWSISSNITNIKPFPSRIYFLYIFALVAVCFNIRFFR